MTSEVAILNRNGIALAADSAATIGAKNKVFNSANKLFSLSKHHPVGIMVYGSADMMDIPWELIIKDFRERLGDVSFETIKGYADEFLRFLLGFPLVTETRQKSEMALLVRSFYMSIVESLDEQVQELLEVKTSIPISKVRSIAAELIDEAESVLRDSRLLDGWAASDEKTLANRYGPDIEKLIEEVFEKIPVNKQQKRRLAKMGTRFLMVSSEIEDSWMSGSGVVIAGYGEQEYYPSLVEHSVRGIVSDKVRHVLIRDCRSDGNFGSRIVPFAQSEMIFAFMEGIDPDLLLRLQDMVEGLFKSYASLLLSSVQLQTPKGEQLPLGPSITSGIDQMLVMFWESVRAVRDEFYATPVMTALKFLGKSELAEMAEALVSLASFKKRMTLDAETVGGPIDVMVISKGDGLVWIKRKHYFDPELNHAYFAKYFK